MTGSIRDPLDGSPWSAAATVSGFASGAPNHTLMQFAGEELARGRAGIALDLGCGAGRNAVPLARLGWRVLGVDLSLPMLVAAHERAHQEEVDGRVAVALAPMEHLPVADRSCDLVVAHGIWNLASSGQEFRDALRDAARTAKPGAALFVFTFSRNTLESDVEPVAGESFVFTEFSGTPQCFLTRDQLVDELAAVGFAPDPAVPLHELNRRPPGPLGASRAPVIWEGSFRYRQ